MQNDSPDFHAIERKWQEEWRKARIFEAEPDERQKFFITIPYPYLNGNLHAGHTRTLTIGDAVARYKRMNGYNVLFPMGYHVTGTPIIGLAERIAKKDPDTIKVYTTYHDVPLEDLLKLDTPEKIVEYFSREATNALKSIGYSIDWRRVFTTTDEPYQKFIEWQYWKLKEKGLVVKGSHPVRYCPHDENPVEDHDLMKGENATIVDFTVIKLYSPEVVFPCATLRPETIFGVTNLWINPSGSYVIAEVNGEKWFLSREAAEKLVHQEKDVKVLKEVNAREYIGEFVVNPVLAGMLADDLVKALETIAEFTDIDPATLEILRDASRHEDRIERIRKVVEKIDVISRGLIDAFKAGFEIAADESRIESALEKLRMVVVPVLPAEFVDTDNATGVVMSVPAHAPYDYVALEDLKRESEELRKIADVKPIVLIRIEGEDYEVPAVEVSEEMGIKSQKEVEKLERATKTVYRKEFHKGVLLENTLYPEMPVSKVKDVLQKDLIELGIGDIFYEFSEKPVVCRCGTKCVVKIVRDQWFLNYSRPEWKEKVFELLEEMRIIPDYYKEEFRNKVEWLKDKACARRKGLGTRIPWDREWLIESLSDSTIYMAYYILAKFINAGKLKAENITQELLDYVFLNIGDAERASESSGLSKELVEEIKRDFDYWYPVDLRSSGKDLVANHLLFFLFHHVAIFPKELWPRAIAVNGYVSLEGKKMSKSKGPLLTMKRAVAENGADVTRMYILYAAEYDSDADWRKKDVESLASHLKRFYALMKEYYTKEVKENGHLERWLVSRMQRAIKETREAMENLQTRRAVNAAFFEVMNDVRWYLRRGGKNPQIVFDDWIKLISPFAPHICEEVWHWKHDSFVSLEKYPEYDESRVDEVAEVAEEYLKSLMNDIKEVLKFVKAETVYVAPAEEWKKEVARIAIRAGNVKDAMKEVMKDEKFRGMGKEVSNFVKRVLKESGIVEVDEKRVIEESREFLERELGVKVVVDESKVPENKRKAAMPGKPAVYAV